MSALELARVDLERRRQAADEADDWLEYAVLGSLVDVADHTKRVGDHPDSPHYRADKAGPLLDAAIRLQQDVFLAYVTPGPDTPADREIRDAVRALRGAALAVRIVLWRAAQAELNGDPPGVFAYQATQIREAAGQFADWAGRVTATPRPDPEEGD